MSVFLRKQTINIIIATFLMHLDRPTYVCTGKLITYDFGLSFLYCIILFLKTKLPLVYHMCTHVRLFFYCLQAGARFLELPGNIVPPLKLATKRFLTLILSSGKPHVD